MKPFITKATQLVQRTAKDMAPKDTGYLARSIKRETTGKGSDVTGRVYTSTEYAPYQEFGTVKMNAQPFMFPALQRHRQDIQGGAKTYIQDQLLKLGK
jgi:HK97 gp10 family phage protein